MIYQKYNYTAVFLGTKNKDDIISLLYSDELTNDENIFIVSI